MTTKLITTNIFVALALIFCLGTFVSLAEASEVTGTLTAGAATPAPGPGGSLSGTVTGGAGGSLTGTVEDSGGGSSSGSGGGGGSSGGGGGGGNDDDDDDFDPAPTGPVTGGGLVTYPGFPNAGYAPEDENSPLAMSIAAALMAALTFGAMKIRRVFLE